MINSGSIFWYRYDIDYLPVQIKTVLVVFSQELLREKKGLCHIYLNRLFQPLLEFKSATFHVNVSSTNHLATAAPKCTSVVCCHPVIQTLKGSQKTSWDLQTLCKRSRFSMSSPTFPGYVWSKTHYIQDPMSNFAFLLSPLEPLYCPSLGFKSGLGNYFWYNNIL